MRTVLIIILFLKTAWLYAQIESDTFQYHDPISGFNEVLLLQGDSFAYTSSIGLCRSEVYGSIEERGDELLLTSQYQPNLVANRFQDSTVQEGHIRLQVSKNMFQVIDVYAVYGIVDTFRKRLELVHLRDEDVLWAIFDGRTYQNTCLLDVQPHGRRIFRHIELVVYRNSLSNERGPLTYRIKLDRSDRGNVLDVSFERFPHDFDYVFFVNQRVRVGDSSLVFLDPKGREMRTIAYRFTRKGIKVKRRDKAYFLERR